MHLSFGLVVVVVVVVLLGLGGLSAAGRGPRWRAPAVRGGRSEAARSLGEDVLLATVALPAALLLIAVVAWAAASGSVHNGYTLVELLLLAVLTGVGVAHARSGRRSSGH